MKLLPDKRVFVVDDDASVRRSLSRLLAAADYPVETFASAADFLARQPCDELACVVLDLAMPGMDGLSLQAALAERGWSASVVFLSGHGDVPSTVAAMKLGAVDFLTKPVDEKILLDAIEAALAEQAQAYTARQQAGLLQARFQRLSPRERQVMSLVVAGLRNKQIAAELGISEKTVKVHRARVMEKTGVRSLAELVQLHQEAALNTDSPTA